MARHDAVFGGEHSAHYYFRDFWFADTGHARRHAHPRRARRAARAAEHPHGRPPALRRLGRDQLHRPGCRCRHRARARLGAAPERRDRRARRPHPHPRRRPGRPRRPDVVAQPARLEHRAPAAPQRRGCRRADDGPRPRRGARASSAPDRHVHGIPDAVRPASAPPNHRPRATCPRIWQVPGREDRAHVARGRHEPSRAPTPTPAAPPPTPCGRIAPVAPPVPRRTP